MKKILIAIFLLYANIVFSQSYKALNNEEIHSILPSNSRVVVSLDGAWQRTIDESNWTTVTLPLSETKTERVIYQRAVKISKNLLSGYIFHLYFLGIEDQVEVYFNEQYVGKYFGGLTPFNVPIPPKMINGETNTIKLIFSPAESYVKQIKSNSIYAKKVFNGMLREVMLVSTPKVFISDIKNKITLRKELNAAKVRSEVKITSSDLTSMKGIFNDSTIAGVLSKVNISVSTAIYLKSNNTKVVESNPKNITIESQRTLTENFDLDITNPALWSPDSPNLYYLKVTLSRNGQIFDDFATDIGFTEFKTLKANNKNIFSLNGQDFLMKGVAYIEDYATNYQTLSPKRMEDDIIMIKNLGANTVRIKYNVPHPYFMYLCNKYGLFVLIDMPIYDVPSKIIGSDEVRVRLKNIAERSFSAYENFVSLAGWGVYSGGSEQDQNYEKYSKVIKDFFHSHSSKMVFKIVNFGAKSINTDDYDFIGLQDNNKKTDFGEIKSEISRLQSIITDKPLFFNFGLAIHPNNHNGYADKLSLEYQAYYIRNLCYISKDRELSGIVVSNFSDYATENPILQTSYDELFLITNGLVDQYRHQRLAFKTLQTFFTQEKEPLLNAGSSSELTPFLFILLALISIIVLIYMINRFKRFKEYLFRSLTRPYNFYSDIRDQRIMSSIHTFILGALISISVGIYFSSLFYMFRSSEIMQYLIQNFFLNQNIEIALYRLIWMPEILLISLTIIFFLMMFIIAWFLRVFAYFLRARIFLFDTMTITIWAGVPFLLLLPIGFVLIRILSTNPHLLSLLLIYGGGLILWVLFRIFKSTSVVFDKPAYQVYSIGSAVLIVMIFIPTLFLHLKYAVFDYYSYIFNVLLP